MKNLICRGLIVVLTVFLQLMPCYATTESGYINDRWVGNVQYSEPSKDSNGEYKVTIENVDGTSMSIPSSVTLTYYNADNDTTKDYECYVYYVVIPVHVETVSVSSAGKLYGVSAKSGSLKSISCEGDFAILSLDSCTSLEEVSLAGAIKTISFDRCNLLTSIAIPSGVTSMSFLRCSSLKSVTIPDSVTSIGYEAFRGCSALTSVTIPDSVTSIGSYAFYYCSGLKSVTIGSGVTSIGDAAFCGCSALTSVTIPDSVTSIGNKAFSGCRALTSVTIGSGVTSIGEGAFRKCSTLTSVTIPDSVTSIGEGAFRECSALTSVTIGSGVTSIGDEAFRECSALTSVTIPDSVTSIREGAFEECSALTSVTIGSGVTSIRYRAFYGCSTLTSVTIPDSVTSIGECAFASCSALTSVTIPDSVTSIGACAFSWCSTLTSVTIPDSVTSIGGNAFSCCSALIKAYIPFSLKDSVEGLNVFGRCSSSLKKVYYNSIPEIAVDADEAAVEEAVASVAFVDAAVKQMIGGSAEKYNAFKSWANGIAGGEAMAITSPYAAVSYLFGSTAVFKAEPKVEIESVAMKEPASSTQEQAIKVEVVVKDGANAVKVATDKVAAMFEATSDLGDWDGEAKLTPIVSVLGTDQNGKMSFTVKPGEGKATRAFLRIKQ